MRTSITDLWKMITKAERKLEETMIEEPALGYRQNMFGSFDREDLTAQLLALYARLEEQSRGDSEVKYRHAGALMRASEFEDARRLYTDVCDVNTSALLMLAMLELKCGNLAGAEARMADYNRKCDEEGIPFMKSSLEKVALARQKG